MPRYFGAFFLVKGVATGARGDDINSDNRPQKAGYGLDSNYVYRLSSTEKD